MAGTNGFDQTPIRKESCPHPRYCVEPERGTHQHEFRQLVEALHAAGLGVILDVELSRTLARLPLIAEAWDARGLTGWRISRTFVD